MARRRKGRRGRRRSTASASKAARPLAPNPSTLHCLEALTGIFRTMGITRRRTRPNRFSNRTVAKPLALGAPLAATPQPEDTHKGPDQGQRPASDSKLAATGSKRGSEAREGATPGDSPGSGEEGGAGRGDEAEGAVRPGERGRMGPGERGGG